ncbi:MAG: AAA family ATPase [Candidatus Micrarchaeaceae archaeon]
MLRICISGLTCSGKTSIGTDTAKLLNVMHVTKKSTAAYRRMLADLKNRKDIGNALIETMNAGYARAFDKEITKIAESNDCVVTTWLGPWMVKDATIRVLLYADIDERAQRASKRDRCSMRKAKAYIMKKDELSTRAAKRLYGININENAIFDIEINTERLNKNEIISLVSLLALEKEEGSGFR